MSSKQTEVEITDEDVSDISDEMGIEESFVKNVADIKKANSRYKQKKREMKSDDENISYITKTKNLFLLIVSILTSAGSLKRNAEVVDIGFENNSEGDFIKITLETDYQNIVNEDKDRIQETFRYNIDTEFNKIETQLELANVNQPDELIDKKLPIKWYDGEFNRDNGVNEVRFKLFENIETVLDKVKCYAVRILYLTNSIGRLHKHQESNQQEPGMLIFKKNISLMFGGILLLPYLFGITFGFSSIFLSILSKISTLSAITTILANYGTITFIQLFRAVRDYSTNTQGNRNYIESHLKKFK